MKILFHGHLDRGEHSKQRAAAMAKIPGIELILSPIRPASSTGWLVGVLRSIGWRLGRPVDEANENAQLLALAIEHRPDVVYVENSKQIRAATLRQIKAETGALLAYFSPDDIVAPHNVSHWLKDTFPIWDIFFTTKSFLLDELRLLGVRRPQLVNNIFTPDVHRPMTPEEVGPEYEAFDFVFVGTFEREREASLRTLAQQGYSVLVHGSRAGRLSGGWDRLRRAGVTVRPAVVDLEYARAVHRGKLALAFLRKINRDLITQRSIELPAMGRAMLAEKTDEHDQHFVDGTEYVGFASDQQMIAGAKLLLSDSQLRRSIGEAARSRCFASGYDVDTLMAHISRKMGEAILARV
jgi:hypothetical protein